MNRWLKIGIHPVFIFLFITLLECIPYTADKTIRNQLPKAGDNFRTLHNPTVYYYDGRGKFSYASQECFFRFGNPPFETNPDDGGVKYVAQPIADQIPLLGDMCSGGASVKPARITPAPAYQKYLSTNYLLDNFSEIAHFLCYTCWSLSLMYYFRAQKSAAFKTFSVCFLGGAALEMVQLFFIQGRNASWEDQMLNSLGALSGILLFRVLSGIIQKRVSGS